MLAAVQPESLSLPPGPHVVPGFCVVMPARNEAPTIGALVRRIVAAYGCEVVVVDDASSDATAAHALEAGATVLRLAEHGGAWCAAQTGFRHVLARGCGLAVTMDADGQHRPETITQVLEKVRGGRWDVAIGSCPDRAGPLKKTAWAMLRGMAGCPVADITSGLRAYNRRAMEALLTPDALCLDYQDIGVLLLLSAAGLSVCEVRVPMSRRGHGRSRQFPTLASIGAHFFSSSRVCLALGPLRLARLLPGEARTGSGQGGRRLRLQRMALCAPGKPVLPDARTSG